MEIRDFFVRTFICNGKMTGIVRVAKTKPVKILMASGHKFVVPSRRNGGATYIL
jgi:hypothetical protein